MATAATRLRIATATSTSHATMSNDVLPATSATALIDPARGVPSEASRNPATTSSTEMRVTMSVENCRCMVRT